VRHREGASWTVVAGPYEVHVVGTKFTVDWQQPSNTFRVAVTEGRVRVTGGELGERVVYLEPGQQWERRDPPPAPLAAVSAAPAGTEPELEPAQPPAVSPQVVAPRSPRAAASAPPPDRPATIAELTKSGKYRDAVDLAEQQGFERVIRELPEGELLGLGNAARYTGQRGRARQAMLAVRDRFSGRPAAGLAALYLARIAEQLEHDPKEAARWLRVFLAGSPTGSLAADARASLLSILLASGDTAGATAVARDYLRFHPTGPFADRARVLVTRADSK
jgi:transmembrane sensor